VFVLARYVTGEGSRPGEVNWARALGTSVRVEGTTTTEYVGNHYEVKAENGLEMVSKYCCAERRRVAIELEYSNGQAAG